MITARQAIQKLPTDVNFSEEKLSANIPAAEYRWGRQFFGRSFWEDLSENIDTKEDYKVLWQQVLWEYIAWAVLYESRFAIQWSISTQGFMLNNTEYSQSDRNAYKNISGFLYDRVQLEQQKVNDFLTTWPSKFPLYGPNKDGCCNKPRFIEEMLGVNVQVERHNCGCGDNAEPDFPKHVAPEKVEQSFNVNCPDTSPIRLTSLFKNDVLLDSELPKDFISKNDLLNYLQGFDQDWALDKYYAKITSSDVWTLNTCCV